MCKSIFSKNKYKDRYCFNSFVLPLENEKYSNLLTISNKEQLEQLISKITNTKIPKDINEFGIYQKRGEQLILLLSSFIVEKTYFLFRDYQLMQTIAFECFHFEEIISF